MVTEQLAELVHEVNRAICELQGDTSQPTWADAPFWQRDSAHTGIRNIVEGRVTTPRESHEGWLKHKRADGWVYGPVKDAEAKLHPCMVEYTELPFEQRIKDSVYFAIVKQLTKENTDATS